MKKKLITYADLSKKQLQILKEIYIKEKVESMSHKELKEFVLEIISHQINDTIGKEEEIEAWEEMSAFFSEQFEKIVLEIRQKYVDDSLSENFEEDTQKYRAELLENNIENSKTDMWDD